MTAQAQLPLPKPTPLSRPFWEACKLGVLTAQRCLDCGGLTFIPQVACMHCFSSSLEWVPTSGKGVVYSYTVVWRPQTPAFKIPYVVAIVDIDDGYQMMSNIVDCDPAHVRVGMRVEVDFRQMSDEITLPYFKPVG